MAVKQNLAAANGEVCEIIPSAERDYSQNSTSTSIPQCLARIPKSKREEFRVYVRKFTNFVGAELRVYQLDGTGNWKETKRGVAMRPKALQGIIEGLQLARGRL
jgi:hypothetical protein